MKNPKDSCSYYIDLLCEKFRNRGIAEKVKSDVEADERKSARAKIKSSAEKSNVKKSAKYKSGVYNGKPYMSSEDFARYYNSTRQNIAPKAEPRDEEEYKKAAADAQGEIQLQSKKEMRLAVFRVIKEKLGRALKPLSRPSKLINEVNRGFDDGDETISVARQRAPRGVMPAIILIGCSLLLIVTSSVMVSRAESDVSRLEKELEVLRDTEAKLYTDLEVKNNMIEIKKIAESKYGMVGAEYLNSKYVSIKREDQININAKDKNVSAVVEFLRALGIKPKK